MKLHRRAAISLALTAALVAPVAGSATTASAYTALPAHVYAPYYETYLAPNTPSITATAQASGARYFTPAFLQSTGKNSCSLDWNGNSAQPLNYYASDIASLRAMGGDVIPSFGGYSADHGGTEIADSCTNVQSIAADYEQVITTLGVTRLDMDVESSSLNNTAGITRRNQAIALTEQWAAANGIPLQIQYTIPVEQYGLDPNGEAVLQSAVANGATVTSVNIMVFDYYIAKEGVVEMGTAAENAANNTHTQLQSIFPSLTSAQIWSMEGMTLLPGIDDLRKKTEVTYEADATTMLNFAQSPASNMNFLSIWAIQRDNGGCPGTVDSNTCSGITQNTWDFSHILEPFTG
jgi:Glycosyl hydrolases family 18